MRFGLLYYKGSLNFLQIPALHFVHYPLTATSEVMTIVILFQASGFRNFKTYYTQQICEHLLGEFPDLVSYGRFVELQSEIVLPLAAFLHTRFGPCTGISFIDSTPIKVCHNLRIKSNKVFRELAKRGKTSTGWFYGFKVHLVINDCGELLAVMITPGNVDDRKPAPRLARRLWGKLFGDRGYISTFILMTWRLCQRPFFKLSYVELTLTTIDSDRR